MYYFRTLSFLTILTWLIVELPFAVRVEDRTPVSTEVLQMAQNKVCTSIAERRIENIWLSWNTEWALSIGPWFILGFQHQMLQ